MSFGQKNMFLSEIVFRESICHENVVIFIVSGGKPLAPTVLYHFFIYSCWKLSSFVFSQNLCSLRCDLVE